MKIINKSISIIIIGLAFLLPLFFGTWTSEFFEFNKQAFLFTAVLVLSLLWAVKIVLAGKVQVIRTPLDLPITLLAIVFLISIVFSQNRLISATTFSTWLFPALGIFYFAAVNNLKTKKQLFACCLAILLSGLTLALWAILQYSLNWQFSIGNFQLTRAFSPIGGIPSLSLYLLVTIFLVIGQFIARQKRELKFALATGLIGSLALVAFLLINPLTSGTFGKITNINFPRPVLLDFRTSWAVAIEAVKNYPLFGIGPGLYLSAFSQYKPLSFNASPYWHLRFGAAHNQWLQVLTTNGLLGLAVFGFLMAVIARSIARRDKFPTLPKLHGVEKFALTLTPLLLSSFFIVWTTPLAFLLFLFLALWQREEFLNKPRLDQEVQISVLAIPTVFPLETIQKKAELLPKIIIGPTLLIASPLPTLFLGQLQKSSQSAANI